MTGTALAQITFARFRSADEGRDSLDGLKVQEEGELRVVVVDQNIPFERMVVIAIKWALAIIPALILLYFVLWVIITILDSIQGQPTMHMVTSGARLGSE